MKICLDIAEDFASLPAECITKEAFIQKAQEILPVYPKSTMSPLYPSDICVYVEMLLRNELYRHTEAFQELAENPKIAPLYVLLAPEYEYHELNLLHQDIQAEAHKISEFYLELMRAVSMQNKQIRYNNLHEILAK